MAQKEKNRLRATLPRSSPQYHCRWDPSLLCSEWEQVFPSRYGNRNNLKIYNCIVLKQQQRAACFTVWGFEVCGLQPFATANIQLHPLNLFSRRKKLRSSLTAN